MKARMAALPNKEPMRDSTDDVLHLLEALESKGHRGKTEIRKWDRNRSRNPGTPKKQCESGTLPGSRQNKRLTSPERSLSSPVILATDNA